MIHTSYYSGEIIGEPVSISLYPPKGWKGKSLPLFAPTRELLQGWKSSDNATTAQEQYKQQFREILQSRQQMIDLWVNRQQRNPQDITLLCYEKPQDFCHRHLVGEKVVQKYLPELWGGEVAALGSGDKGIGLTDTPKVPIDCTFPPLVKSLLAKCHDAGDPVICDRIPCGYYQVFLHGQDLGVWSELGVLCVLSGLRHPFDRARLVQSYLVLEIG